MHDEQKRLLGRLAEKEHVQRMGSTEWLEKKPFLGEGGLDVDRALTEIGIFSGMVGSLPFGPGSKILDAGAGPCWISEWLQRLGFDTTSTDLAVDMLKVGGKRLVPGSKLVAGDMAALPLADGCMDGVVCYGALHHVPDWREALREFHRVLGPNGILVLQEPGRGHAKQAESVAQMEQFGVLEQDLPPRQLRRACLAAGFRRAWIRPLAEIGFGRTRLMRPYPFFREAPKLFVRKRLSLLRATLLERALNVVSPMHFVVAAKGAVMADSCRPDTMVARIRHLALPESVQGGQPVAVCLRVVNTGLTVWRAHPVRQGMGHVQVGVSLLDRVGQRAEVLDFARLPLPHEVAPGEEVEIQGALPPVPRGQWTLRFDLVAEGLFWFANKGSRPVTRTIESI